MASQGPRVALLVSIGVLGLWFLWALLICLRQAAGRRSAWVPSAGTWVTGFVTTFFDTLGIGSERGTEPSLVCTTERLARSGRPTYSPPRTPIAPT
jgi:hypothetical protein